MPLPPYGLCSRGLAGGFSAPPGDWCSEQSRVGGLGDGTFPPKPGRAGAAVPGGITPGFFLVLPPPKRPHLAARCEMSQLPARSSRDGRPLLIPPRNTPGSFVMKYGRAKPHGGSVLGAVTPKILWHPQDKALRRSSSQG